jgi:NAD(P)-dependent dehydrogenase (short-subunit alcohol dehydrogenase family)
MDMFSLKGKVALITGAGNPIGYGAQCASALYEAGAEVWIASRDVEKLKTFTANYPGMKYLPLDLADETQVKNIILQITAQSGKLDILVNNAVARTALAQWVLPMVAFDQSFHVNASALFLLTRIAAENMKSSGGSIINIGSYMGICGLDHANYDGTGMQTDGDVWPSPAYHYEKGGMLNFTRWAASVLGKYNIRVNCVTLIGLEPLDGKRNQFHRQHAGRTLLNRCCGNEDLKGGIVYLASEASAFVTGSNLVIDGGYSAI